MRSSGSPAAAPTVDCSDDRGRWGNSALGSREGGDGAGVHGSGRGGRAGGGGQQLPSRSSTQR
jgi:hypothetical protein